MKFFNKTALVVLLTAFTTIACTNQGIVEDTNYKVKDIEEPEVIQIVDEQPSEDNEEVDFPTAKKDPIINVKRDRD
ncbi:hypothetical protein [Flavobacteriaceae bacterium 14752]|uniref:hypothetical protein n=1 Tax=Mesohalobacter salilacus TaxID=2491711 RepID=UPI000F638AB2|nr:hypothetical protein EIG84_03745 [Flavobacteriaceae bacterium 14752]